MATRTALRGEVAARVELLQRERPLRPDLFLVVPFIMLSSLGILMVYSASAPRLDALGLDPASEMRRQIVFVLLGTVVFIGASLLDGRTLHALTPALYLGSVFALVLVLTGLGGARFGAQRWLELGGFQLQPAEFAKVAVILGLAAQLAQAGSGRFRWNHVARSVALVGIPAFLIFLQPDLGTMLVFGFIALAMLFVAGASRRQIAFLTMAAIIGTVGVFQLGAIRDYQVERITAFLDDSADPDTRYNQDQSEMAIGSGGVFGQGLFKGALTNLKFVPVQSTDFIFTAVGEQLGFVGGTFVIGLYAIIVWRLLTTAVAARDRFGSLIAVGVASMITFHVFVNIGMTIRLMPVTGLPLPLLSSGGSAFVATSLALGIAHAVWMRRSPVPGDRPVP